MRRHFAEHVVEYLALIIDALEKTFAGAWYKHVFAWIGVVVAAAFPTEILFYGFLLALSLVIVDSVTGLICAWRSGDGASSNRFWVGTITKLTGRIILALVLTFSVQTVAALVTQHDTYAASAAIRAMSAKTVLGLVLAYWIFTEFHSIVENLEKAGFEKLPKGVKRFIRGSVKKFENQEVSVFEDNAS